MQYPKMFRIHQRFEDHYVEDIPGTVRDEVGKLQPDRLIKPGQSVAVAVGSRGIANHSEIVKCVVLELQALGAVPYIVPAMGSHGGGTAEGQRAVLAMRGITEEAIGVPIKSSMDVIQLGTTDFEMPVFFDRYASEADHIVLVNRVKPHTRFAGRIESGLMKMMAIGLGKRQGASIYHQAFAHYSFDQVVRSIYEMVRQRMPIAFGVAILENGYQQTAQITAISANDIVAIEQDLLIQARAWCPRLPFNDVDLLIIDEIGKDISGAGMDTGVTGLKKIFCPEIANEMPQVQRIFVRELTEGSRGNAMGLGLADFTTKRLVDQIDLQATYTNAVTGQNLRGAVIPVHFTTDMDVLNAAFAMIGSVEPEQAKVVWIKNTLNLSEVEVSVAYLQRVCHRTDLTVLTELRSLAVEADGNLPQIERFGHRGTIADRGSLTQEMKQELQRLGSLDELTQVYNRYHFDLTLEQEWRRMVREKSPLSVVMVGLSPLHTEFDRETGLEDTWLQDVARVISHTVKRPADVVARYGRDQFCVLLPVTEADGALRVARLIESEVKALKVTCLDQQMHKCLSVSLGVATIFPTHESSPQALIDAADKALHQARDKGSEVIGRIALQVVAF